MQVFKFGGASVKSADAVRNIAQILKNNTEKTLIVISAMDKTTNALERLFQAHYNKRNFDSEFLFVKNFHFDVLNQLFDKSHTVHNILEAEFSNLWQFLTTNTNNDFDFVYDQIVSYGEIFSTIIISHYLNSVGIKNIFIDARQQVLTDNNFRYANILFEPTQKNLLKIINENNCQYYIIQGFIGTDGNNNFTTLGREGSDYSAATFANLIDAKNLTLWKDVAGMYNADPKIFPNAIKLEKISFREATELAYFGAKIIHPKTARPLMIKNIPLYIRSFKNPSEIGTNVENINDPVSPLVPIFIFSPNQVLLTIYNDDFIDEQIFEQTYAIFKKFKTKVNLVQNSALSLSLCFDYNANNFDTLISEFQSNFKIRYNTDLILLNIRHYEKLENFDFLNDKQIILQQKSRVNAMYLYK